MIVALLIGWRGRRGWWWAFGQSRVGLVHSREEVESGAPARQSGRLADHEFPKDTVA